LDYANGVASFLKNGTANAPAAGISFVALANGTYGAGWYEIAGFYVISGAVETQPLNVQLFMNGNNNNKLPSGGALGSVYPFRFPRVKLDGTQVSLDATANATASTVYTGFLTVTELAD
jgi:hypothetical protein